MSDSLALISVLYLLLSIAAILIAGIMELLALRWILLKTTNQKFQLVILALAFLPGYVLLMTKGAPLLFLSLLLIAPIAALIPPVTYSCLPDPRTRFRRIFFVYIPVSLVGIILFYGCLISGVFLFSIIFNQTPLSTITIYVGFSLPEILVAFVVYWLMPGTKAPNKEMEES